MTISCKPDIKDLGKEAKYKLISSQSHIYSSSSYSVYEQKDAGKYLFDGKIDGYSMSWRESDDYVEIEILEKCNIWGYKCEYNISHNMYIEKKMDNGKFVDITNINKYKDAKTGVWSKIFENIDKGIYRVKSAGGEIKYSEWYLEKIQDTKYLIKQNDLYYSIKSEYYHEEKFDNTLVLIDNINDKSRALNTLKNLDLSKFSNTNYNIIKL